MFKNFRKKHGLTKTAVKESIEFFQNMAGIKLSEAMTRTYDDSVMLLDKVLKAVLMNMGWNIQSIEVRQGDSLYYNGEWNIDINLSNHSNHLIGVFTKLTHPEHTTIQNFTTRQYIDTIAEAGGINWEKWFEEAAVMASLKQTLRRSQLGFLAKPILLVEIQEKSTTSTAGRDLIKEIVTQATAEESSEVHDQGTTDAPTDKPIEESKEEPVEVPKEEPVEVPKEEPVEESKEEPVEVSKEEPVEVSKEEPVEESKDKPIDDFEDDLDELLSQLVEEFPKWVEVKEGKNLRRDDWKSNRDIIEQFGRTKSEHEQQLLAELLNSVKPYGIKSETINFQGSQDDSQPPFRDSPQPSFRDESSTPFDEGGEIPGQAESGIPSVDASDETTERAASKNSINKTVNGKMTNRQWMVAFGNLEKRWAEGEFGIELLKDALKLQMQAPQIVNERMINPDKYLKAK